MKNFFITSLILFIICSVCYSEANNRKNLSLTEEDKSFWDTLLNDKSVNNKNLLYASYIAYKDRLNDLSIETFQECLSSNTKNSVISGISTYYIAKNLFLIGKYEDAISQFMNVEKYELAGFNYLKMAAILNIAISYYHIGNDEKFRENLQKVISNDLVGNYKKTALSILSMVQ